MRDKSRSAYGERLCFRAILAFKCDFLAVHLKTQLKVNTYDLTGLLCARCTCELYKSIATRLVVVLDADSSTHDGSELLKSLVKVFVGPVNSKAFHENVALGLTASEEFFIVGKCTTNFAVKLRVLYVVE